MSLLGEARALAQDHGLWWPDGDPGRLRELAYAWQAAGAACAFAAEDAALAERRIHLDNHGEALDAFAAHTHRVELELGEQAERCRHVAATLLGRADEIEQARRRIEAIAAEVAAALAVGAAVSFLTAGVAGAIAADVTAGLIAEAAALEVAVSETAVALSGRVAAYAFLGAWEGGVVDIATQTSRALVQNRDPFESFSAASLNWSAGTGFVIGGLLGGLTFVAPSSASPSVLHGSLVASPRTWGDVRDVLESLPRGQQKTVRLVATDEDIEALFGRLTAGGTPIERPGYNGRWFELDNGTQVGMRTRSKSGGWTIDVTIGNGDFMKVHTHAQ